jgi:hypothetical protein
MSSNANGLIEIGNAGPSRRDVLRQIALALTAAGAGLSPAAAQTVHEHVKDEKAKTGAYKPKGLNQEEFDTVGRLAELILPADERGGSAKDAGAAEFIDLLCSENEQLTHIYTGGLGWLDARMRKRHGVSFLAATQTQQTAMLDMLVEADKAGRGRATVSAGPERGQYAHFMEYGLEKPSDLLPGVHFFDWVRKMSVDAYYTSPMGVKDLGYLGNIGMPEYKVPQEAIDYAMNRSPFKKA